LPSGRKVRLAHSPHFSAFRQPYGLEQKAFCSLGAALGESGVVGCANGAAKRYAARKSGLPLVGLRREAPRYAPGFPLPAASSFRWPVRSTPGPAILSFKRPSFTLAPVAVTASAYAHAAPAPTLRAASVAPTELARRTACATRAVAASPRSFRRFAFQARRGGGLENEALRLSPENRPPRIAQDARSRSG